MKATKIIELIYKAMPSPDSIRDFEIKGDNVYFKWSEYHFRVSDELFVEEYDGTFLTTSSVANLVERLLNKYNTNNQ